MVKEWRDALVHLFYPSLCFGCNNDIINSNQFLCMECHASLGYTRFENIRHNPVEKRYWGRVDLQFATSTFYYIEKTPLQKIIHQIKYRQEPALGRHMGELMGMAASEVFKEHETAVLVPMPLHPKREYKRGYNQATLLCEGITKTTGIAYNEKVLVRNEDTRTQTKKSRTERWENVAAVFEVADHQAIANKNIVLVDDVITTGASTEACATALLQHGAKSVGVCSLAFTL
jgi:ComF family protein